MQSLLKFFKKIKTFFKIKNQDKLAFIKAFIYMGYFRSFILFVPFNKLRKRMGKIKLESPQEVDDECYKKGYYLVKPTYEINNNNIYIKDKITSGDIILISDDLKVEYYKAILKTLNYNDLKVYKLSYLISEKRD